MWESVSDARGAFTHLLSAHFELLKAELSLAGRELGIIVGLAFGALILAILVGILIYVGSFLFFGDWLFGSMAWGILHGTLLGFAIIGFVAVNLAGGSTRAYGWGFVVGLVSGVVVALILASNLLPEGASAVAGEAQESIDLAQNLLATLTGALVGAAILALVAVIVGWRQNFRGSSLLWATVAAALLGAFVGAIVASALWSYAGAAAIGVTIGLLTWMTAGALLAYRRGFDPESRYASLVPRESVVAFERTRDFLEEQWSRQKGRMMGR